MKEGDVLHKCDVCGKTEVWNDNWGEWGSIVSSENAGRNGIWKVCSDVCKNKYSLKEIEQQIIDRCGFNPFKLKPYG